MRLFYLPNHSFSLGKILGTRIGRMLRNTDFHGFLLIRRISFYWFIRGIPSIRGFFVFPSFVHSWQFLLLMDSWHLHLFVRRGVFVALIFILPFVASLFTLATCLINSYPH
jgi:Na+/phosphate symporter